ncbi:hypothetical protein DAETH_18650 [Deinococcus aetherius]|uniref:Lipoprotein n=2 Tax=Deinococcus aetherius TaxID=200252 RepID=A0ABM8ADN6_9DEIO|nr:hypothetical protein DAETH_18650 [Deinococcus aetherius]
MLLLPLVLAACQSVGVVTPEELPPLRESALGEPLEFSGDVENWTAGQTAPVLVGQTTVGLVRSDGTLSVSAQPAPLSLAEVEDVLLPAPGGGEERACSLRTLTFSAQAARAYRVSGLNLAASESRALVPQTSPVPPSPMLLRSRGETQVVLVYVDRDVRISGQKSCTGKYWPWDASASTWARGSSINVFLRKGWNTVSITEKYLGENKWQLVVQGGDTTPATPWRYNGVPLSAAPF